MATQLIDVRSSPGISWLELLYNGSINTGGSNGGRILHYISAAGHSNFTYNLVKMWFKLSGSIVLDHFRMYNQHAIDDFTLSLASSDTDESGTVIMDYSNVAGTAGQWSNYYSLYNTSSSQYYFLNIKKWTSVQYFQITEAEFYGNGPFVVGTIELVGDSSYEQLPNTSYVEPGYTIRDANGNDISSQYIVEITGSVDVNTIGEYTLTYTASLDTPDTSSSTSVTRTVTVQNTAPPIITLIGNASITVERGSSYTDAGATSDGGETVTTTGTVNTLTVGTYTITYTATNSYNNVGTATRTVIVQDTIAPIVTLIGNASVTVEKGSSYTDEGATADTGETVIVTGTVDILTVGTYTITYTATDIGNNVGTATRTVTVQDTTAPIVTLIGNASVTVEKGSSYTDEGATADTGETVITTGTVDILTVGTYTITYTATDSENNVGSATRTVTVQDTTAPIVTLIGNASVTVDMGSSYTDEGATADGGETVIITVKNASDETVELETIPLNIGEYTINYKAIDVYSNVGSVTRTVNVVDTIGPVITLEGSNPYTLKANRTYNEPGYTATDNVDGDLYSSVSVTSNVDVTTPGTYDINYSVTDNAGNNTIVTRIVNILEGGVDTVAFNSSIAYIRRDDLATLINSFDEVSSLKEIYNMWYNNTQITGGTDCWIYYAYSTVNNEVLYTSRRIEFLSKNDDTYEWVDYMTSVNASVTSNNLSEADLSDYTSFYSGLEPFNMNLSSTSINIVNTVLNNSGYSLYNYIQIFNIWYNETNAFDMDYDNTTREIDVWVYVLTDETAMEDILDKHATPIEPITDFDEKQITIEMLKPYLLEGGNVQPIFETRKLKYIVKNNNASYTWTLYTDESIESTINDTGYSIISSIDNYKLSYFYFDSYTIVRESSKEALRSLYLAYYNSTQKLKKINEVWYNKQDINLSVTNDSEGPLITVLGENPINIIQSIVSSYREIGVVAIDNADSDVTDQITSTYTNKATNITESTIDTSVVGEYIVTYRVQDSAGNVSTATRDVNIVADTVGSAESLNIKYTLGLYKSSNASVVTNNENQYYLFNGHTTYNSNYQYGLGAGTYIIKNIPAEHPMAILNAGKTLQISYSGDSTKKSSKEVTTTSDGTEVTTTSDGTYDFYYGDITLTVNSNFDKVSVYCYYHGYMGGENLLVYSSDCKIQMPLIDSSSLSVVETTITASDIGMKIYGTCKDLDEYGLSILDSEINNKLDVKYNKNTRKWNTLMNIEPLLTVGSGLEDGLSSNNYFQIYHNIDYNIVQKIPELISKYIETYGEEIGIDKFYESDEIDNAHILDCYMKFYMLSNPISELYTSLEYDRVINSWNVKNPTEVYNSVKANNSVKYSVFRLTHLNNKGDDLKEKYNIVYPLHSIIQIYKLWYNSSSAGDEIVDGIMFYSYKENNDVLVKTQFATVNILYTVMTDTFSVMSETPTIRAYDYNGQDL